MNQMRFALRVLAGALLIMMAACESKADQQARANRAAADSFAAARARGETDLNNPEMGAKVLITLTEAGMEQSHKSVPKGQLTLAIQNRDRQPRACEFKGPAGGQRTVPIQPEGAVLLSMIVGPGEYVIACPDSTKQEAQTKVTLIAE